MKKEKTQVSVLFMLFSILFCVCLIAANVLETKQIAVGSVSLTGGLIVFPVSYIINDCVCEVWGYQKARLLIWTGFAMNFFFVALGAICDMIPAAPYWHNQEGFHAIWSTVAGESCDSLIFFPLALGGVVPAAELPKLMIWQVVLKTVYEIIVLPVTIRVVRFLKHHEGEDVYDKNISYNVFKIFSLN